MTLFGRVNGQKYFERTALSEHSIKILSELLPIYTVAAVHRSLHLQNISRLADFTKYNNPDLGDPFFLEMCRWVKFSWGFFESWANPATQCHIPAEWNLRLYRCVRPKIRIFIENSQNMNIHIHRIRIFIFYEYSYSYSMNIHRIFIFIGYSCSSLIGVVVNFIPNILDKMHF